MLKRILLGLGGTPFTDVAIERAVELARLCGAKLTGVTVLDRERLEKLGPVPLGGAAYAKKMRDKRIEVTQQRIDEAIDRLRTICVETGLSYALEQETGDPFELMISHSRYNDLTIFGLKSLFDYGLIPEPRDALVRLISSGVRPMLAISREYRHIQRVLVAYSGSMESAKAMRRFVQLCPWSGLQLRVLLVQGKSIADDPEKLCVDAADYCADHGFSVDTDIVEGDPKDVLLAYAQEHDFDLLVMGNSIRNLWIRHFLGDTLLHTIQNADRPLFLSQ